MILIIKNSDNYIFAYLERQIVNVQGQFK